jgi:hypothetical protein
MTAQGIALGKPCRWNRVPKGRQSLTARGSGYSCPVLFQVENCRYLIAAVQENSRTRICEFQDTLCDSIKGYAY